MAGLRLFLFDLDGTLVSTGGAGLRALGLAFRELFGIRDAIEGINPSGKTDPAIFREMFRKHLQRDPEPKESAALSSAYLRHLGSEITSSKKTRALDGVTDFVRFLYGRADIVIGLGTGNLEEGARLKLSPTGLNPYFLFGGFGSDAEDRAEVLKFGHRRAESRLQGRVDPASVYVIGDTPLDVDAAHRAGFQSVAVATGRTPIEDLKAAGARYAMKDMSEGFDFLQALEAEPAAAS